MKPGLDGWENNFEHKAPANASPKRPRSLGHVLALAKRILRGAEPGGTTSEQIGRDGSSSTRWKQGRPHEIPEGHCHRAKICRTNFSSIVSAVGEGSRMSGKYFVQSFPGEHDGRARR
jgi:hypothetical protein